MLKIPKGILCIDFSAHWENKSFTGKDVASQLGLSKGRGVI